MDGGCTMFTGMCGNGARMENARIGTTLALIHAVHQEETWAACFVVADGTIRHGPVGRRPAIRSVARTSGTSRACVCAQVNETGPTETVRNERSEWRKNGCECVCSDFGGV